MGLAPPLAAPRLAPSRDTGTAAPTVLSAQELTQLDPQQLVQMQAAISQALHLQSQAPGRPQPVASEPLQTLHLQTQAGRPPVNVASVTQPAVSNRVELADFVDCEDAVADSRQE